MRSPIISVTSDTSIETCAKLMIENKISSLAVIDNTQVNILTKSDLVKLYAEDHRREHLIKDFMTKKGQYYRQIELSIFYLRPCLIVTLEEIY